MLGLCGRGSLIVLMVMAATALIGCEGRPAEPRLPPKPGPLPEVVLETPEDAARTALEYLRADLRAVAHRDGQIEEACIERLRTIAAVAAIEQELARWPQFKAVLGDDPIEGYIDNWAAAIAYYAEGFHFDQMRRDFETPSKVAVVVPASGPEDDALIQVTCIREDDGPCRVSRIEFVVEAPTTRPASQSS
jgi:hypothetical protein